MIILKVILYLLFSIYLIGAALGSLFTLKERAEKWQKRIKNIGGA